MNFNTRWVSDAERRPTIKGEYLTITPTGTIQCIWFDPELGEWNCYTEEHVKENIDMGCNYEVRFWCDNTAELLKALLRGEDND